MLKKLDLKFIKTKPFIFSAIGIGTALIIVLALIIIPQLLGSSNPQHTDKSISQKPAKPIVHYDVLTGEQISDSKLNESPTFCVQVPNGLDGPRPQVGLNQAKVVFEAIAEAGITRFAAIFQNPTSSVIGPIRSLRMYYLDWDIPFNCTIVHAGGSDEAIAAARNYRDLTESRTFMWRNYAGYWAPNNLFTSPALLANFNQEHGYNTSKPVGFARMTPKKAAKNLAKVKKDATKDPIPLAYRISVNFTSAPTFNTIYDYDANTNSYFRSYATGEAHTSYTCPEGLDKPRPKHDCGEPAQIAPKVVIALMVNQNRASDGYHENIQTTGSGEAYIFQNGTAIKGTWSKPTKEDQLSFQDANGKKVSLVPGQTWIAAVPLNTGSVNY